jgi:hypothetical protein
VGGDFVITCDNPVWLVKSTKSGKDGPVVSWLSCDGGDHVYSATGTRTSVLQHSLLDGKLQLAGTEALKFADEEKSIDLPTNIPKEEKKMSNDLDAILNQAEQETSGETPKMTNFDGAPASEGQAEKKGRKPVDPEAKAAKKAERENLENMRKKIKDDVRSATSQNKVDMSMLESVWKKNAQLIAFVSPTDKRQSIAAVKVPVKADKRTVVENAPEDVKAMHFRNPASVPAEWIQTTYEIKGRESKPGKALGVILQIPAFLQNCAVADFVKANVLESARAAFTNNDNATVIELCTMNDFEQKLTFAGGSIQEAASTAPEGGKPGEVKILIGQPNSNASTANNKALADQGMVFAKKIVKVGAGNKTPMHDRNYFPLTTYETVDVMGNISPEDLRDLNRYTFEGLFSPGKNSKQSGTKFDNLVPADRGYIRKNGEDIESDYITNGANRVDLPIAAFYDKTLPRGYFRLPIKRKNTKPDGSLGAPQFVKYNVTMEEKMSDPDYRAKSALGLDEFAHIVSAVGEDLLAPAILKDKFKRSSSTNTVSKYLNADIARELLIAKMGGGLNQYSINGFNFDN